VVAKHDRIGSVDAFEIFGPPGEMEIDLAAGGFEADQTAAGEDETPAPALIVASVGLE